MSQHRFRRFISSDDENDNPATGPQLNAKSKSAGASSQQKRQRTVHPQQEGSFIQHPVDRIPTAQVVSEVLFPPSPIPSPLPDAPKPTKQPKPPKRSPSARNNPSNGAQWKTTLTENLFASEAVETRTAQREDDPSNAGYIPLDTLRATRTRELHAKFGINPTDPCWGCIHRFGQPRQPGLHPNQDLLHAEFCSHLDLMSLDAVSNFVSEFHEKHIYQTEVRTMKLSNSTTNTVPLLWPPAMVKLHITEHMFDVRVRLKAQLERLHEVEVAVFDACFYSRNDDDNGTVLPQVAHIKAITDLVNKSVQSMKSYLQSTRNNLV